ncbi:flagellar type III secretion system protein FlhB [Octadecabacter sp. 1_MG-2023]|uniref:EscU/YscU/HrcU family type III secretion system export apparatus switch protein n=1 Tax=unclassified Octadecabacter TaxID=196158 RepID=UPI001C08670A|nr:MULTISPECIES: flagellar type III secretion system protein FlhB [unclassified Octadecabacter]MBU2992380.1 flagellar type III secretion system protein FlhB [Octadecabacter sp. B2R22]MDO6734863.1 flagellar type III secretion system protein FlhB [Octadecabacter sp. 1_MG-2023]
MSDESNDDDKQFEASQHKLDEARKKGDFPRSTDLNTASAYAGILIAGVSVGAASLTQIGSELAGVIARPDSISAGVFSSNGGPFMGGLIRDIGVALAPWFAIPAGFVILSLMLQKGFVFAPSKLEPKLSRISPISQAKNKFGRSGLFEFGKSTAKLILYCIVLFSFLAGRMPDIMGAMALSPAQIMAMLLRLCISLMSIVLLIAISLGVVDYTWQRAEHLRKNRMSRKELTDENKNSEGDPAMKQKRRQKGVAIAMNQMMADVPDADVIIVNPTHYAVALKWDRTVGGAPECVAKGVDLVAARIREIAQENAVPIHSDPPTARALHATVELGQTIPRDHYKAVAAAIRFADRIRKVARK